MRSILLGACALTLTVTAPAVVSAQTPPTSFPANLPQRQGLQMEMPQYSEDTVLQSVLAAETRPAADKARDAHRHPLETLTFWGLQPGLTVVEIEPGRAGWWRNILEPYAAQTGGTYVPVNRPLEGMGVDDNTADMVVVARAFHNWHRAGVVDGYLQAFFKALKPGGVLAIEQHRSIDGVNVADVVATGYVPESWVIHQARQAGFELVGRSEINANAKDTKNHPFGVWSLPPVRRSEQDGRTLSADERAALDAIGESDRMTLLLRKPATAQ